MIERYPFLEPLFDRIDWRNFSFLHFVKAVEAFRGRAIRLWPVPIPAPLQFGLWLGGQRTTSSSNPTRRGSTKITSSPTRLVTSFWGIRRLRSPM